MNGRTQGQEDTRSHGISHRTIEKIIRQLPITMDKFPVDVWTVSLAQPTPAHLSEDEAARANRFKFEDDRLRWTRARSSLRLILSRYAGEDPARLSFNYGAHGKPSLQPYSDVE